MKRNYFSLGVFGIVILGILFFSVFSWLGETETLDDVFVESGAIVSEFDESKIISGGPPKDGIPSIDNPQFVSVSEADDWIQDNELVLGLNYNSVQKVYPLQILVWHEIVNDWVNGEAVLITYCPLCGSGIAYERTFDGEVVEFGTSGKLYNSNLVMYDRKTDSYWTQIDGVAIVGELAGDELVALPIDTVNWSEWKNAYPDSLVLSQETGFIRNYGRDPYSSYYEEDYLLFPVESEDSRISPKEIVFGIEANGEYKAYLEKDVLELGEFEDNFAGIDLIIERKKSGEVFILDEEGNRLVHERDFWFAWYAFHPDTLVYEKEVKK